MTKKEKLIVVGKSGSGKDFVLKEFNKIGFRSSVKVTTRPKRNTEVDGIDYQFKTNSEFDSLVEKNNMIVHQEFFVEKNPWKYGILREDYENNQIFLMTPMELSQIPDSERKDCFVVYLDIDKDVRESRLLSRNDNNDSINRRLNSDDVDFVDFKDYDLRITDPNFDIDLILDLMV